MKKTQKNNVLLASGSPKVRGAALTYPSGDSVTGMRTCSRACAAIQAERD